MPADNRIDRPERVVYSRAWGVLTDQELTANRAALFGDPAFEPDMAQLFDFTDVTEDRVTSGTLLHLALMSRFTSTARRAIVVSTDVGYGMARMYSMLSGREDVIHVFRDRASALRWLDSTTAQGS